MEFETHSPIETEKLGEKLSKTITKPCVIAFTGGLGVGKTCFTAGLCKGLGYGGDVTSPTFAIVNEYYGGKFPIYHFDMYRIQNEDELYSIGFYDYLDEDAVIVAEWSENIFSALPSNTVFVNFTFVSDNTRKIEIISSENTDLFKEL